MTDQEPTQTDTTPQDAAYHQAAQRQYHRTIDIRTPIDLALYGELLTLITDRWPGAKLTRDGIYVPEDPQ